MRYVILSNPTSNRPIWRFSATAIYTCQPSSSGFFLCYHQLTSSKNLTPAHGNDAWIGSKLTAISPICLNLSIHVMIFSTRSRRTICRPLNSSFHLWSWQSVCFLNAMECRYWKRSSFESDVIDDIIASLSSRDSFLTMARPQRSLTGASCDRLRAKMLHSSYPSIRSRGASVGYLRW